jgi:hypothetical protein
MGGDGLQALWALGGGGGAGDFGGKNDGPGAGVVGRVLGLKWVFWSSGG